MSTNECFVNYNNDKTVIISINFVFNSFNYYQNFSYDFSAINMNKKCKLNLLVTLNSCMSSFFHCYLNFIF